MFDFHTYILEPYKNLSEPDYNFVKTALRNDRYSEVGLEFNRLGFVVQDDTEPNTDVCRIFILSDNNIQACIKLSFVGPFAAVFLLNGKARRMGVILNLLDFHGFRIVPRDTFMQPHDISLFDLDSDTVLYNALFSYDAMPRVDRVILD